MLCLCPSSQLLLCGQQLLLQIQLRNDQDNPDACRFLQAQETADAFGLRAQVVESRGIHLLVELCQDDRAGIRQPAVDALHHLTLTERGFMGILMQATQHVGLLAAVAAGRASPVLQALEMIWFACIASPMLPGMSGKTSLFVYSLLYPCLVVRIQSHAGLLSRLAGLIQVELLCR